MVLPGRDRDGRGTLLEKGFQWTVEGQDTVGGPSLEVSTRPMVDQNRDPKVEGVFGVFDGVQDPFSSPRWDVFPEYWILRSWS